jgi:hypothetical protein
MQPMKLPRPRPSVHPILDKTWSSFDFEILWEKRF